MIAQLGKNYALPQEEQIDGELLLDLATDTISKVQYSKVADFLGQLKQTLKRDLLAFGLRCTCFPSTKPILPPMLSCVNLLVH